MIAEVYIGLEKVNKRLFLKGRIPPTEHIEHIIHELEVEFDLKHGDIRSKSRKREIVEPRMIGLYFSTLIVPKMTLVKIGEYFGGMHYSTVIYNKETCIDLMQVDNKFRQKVQALEGKLL